MNPWKKIDLPKTVTLTPALKPCESRNCLLTVRQYERYYYGKETPPEEQEGCYEYQIATLCNRMPCTVFYHSSARNIINHIKYIRWHLLLEGVTLMKPYRIKIAPKLLDNIEESVQYLFEELMKHGAEFSIRDKGQFIRLSKDNTRMVEVFPSDKSPSEEGHIFNLTDYNEEDWISMSDGSCILGFKEWAGIPLF